MPILQQKLSKHRTATCSQQNVPGIDLALFIVHCHEALGKLGHMAGSSGSAHVAVHIDVIADVVVVC